MSHKINDDGSVTYDRPDPSDQMRKNAAKHVEREFGSKKPEGDGAQEDQETPQTSTPRTTASRTVVRETGTQES